MPLLRRDLLALSLALPGSLAALRLTAAPTAARAQSPTAETSGAASALPEVAAPDTALAAFADTAQDAACLIAFGPNRWALDAERPLFVGSAVKTFLLAQAMREVEAGRLKPHEQVVVDDSVRSPGSPVLGNLTGTTSVTSVLEAMILHSDNTATDIVFARVGADRVRALIEAAGLKQTKVPDSTRRMFSWLAGAEEGQDIGWEGMKRMATGWLPGQPRLAINDKQTMVSTAAEMVHWYETALTGTYFEHPATLKEFKRIHAMADALPLLLPDDTLGYAKGGSIDWDDFHCFSIAGQMIVREQPATFSFTINWTGPASSVPTTFNKFRAAAADLLAEAATVMRG